MQERDHNLVGAVAAAALLALGVGGLATQALAQSGPGSGQGPTQAGELFVADNLRAIFYHELGHALIDRKQLPIFGQEEDAADVFSALLIDALFDEQSATDMAYSTAFGFLEEADTLAAEGGEVAFWDVHGPDLQRYYNLVCLFYGANPEDRADVAADLGLPDERLDSCPEEYDLAMASWGPVLDEMAAEPGGRAFVLAAQGAGPAQSVIGEELAALNRQFALDRPMTVRVEPCGEANAFYDPETGEITICTEFADELAASAPAE